MQYLNKSFTICPGNEKYRENYDDIFRKKDKMCAFCGKEKEILTQGVCETCWALLQEE